MASVSTWRRSCAASSVGVRPPGFGEALLRGLISRQARQQAVAIEVAARVADVDDEELVAGAVGRRQRRAHARERWMLCATLPSLRR